MFCLLWYNEPAIPCGHLLAIVCICVWICMCVVCQWINHLEQMRHRFSCTSSRNHNILATRMGSKNIMPSLGKIEEFDPSATNITRYLERLDQYFVANGVPVHYEESHKRRATLKFEWSESTELSNWLQICSSVHKRSIITVSATLKIIFQSSFLARKTTLGNLSTDVSQPTATWATERDLGWGRRLGAKLRRA